MIDIRRAAAALTLAVTLILFGAGCQPTKSEPESTTVPSADKVAAARERYAAKGDMLVGVVEAANDMYAAVGGIDSKVVNKKDDVFHFIDVNTNQEVNQGVLKDVSAAGRLIIDYDKSATRPPHEGDLVVKLK